MEGEKGPYRCRYEAEVDEEPVALNTAATKCGGHALSNNVKWFQWLAYAALLIGAIQAFVEPTTTRDVIVFGSALTAVTVLCVWLAGRGRMWAALVFVIVAVMMVVSAIGDFWQSAPDWLRLSPSTTMTAKLLGATCAVFAVISVYFFAASRREVP
jgi:hypothetical protein